jgi:hypothetical protein
MKYLICVVILIFSTLSYARDGISLTQKEIQNLSYNQIQKVRNSYIEFVKFTEKDNKYDNKNVFYKYLKGLSLFGEAYADPDQLCFFGGWPSKLEGGYCRSPWKKKSDSLVKEFGAYTSESACGTSDEFRCNPVLFGAPTKEIIKEGSPINGVEVNFSPSKNGNDPGYCVKKENSYVELTQKCERASRKSLPNIIDSYRKDPAQLEKYSSAIEKFCKAKPTYDACDDLAARIKAITGKDIGIFPSTGRAAVKGPGGQGDPNSNTKVANLAKSLLKKCNQFTEEKDIKHRKLFGSATLASHECIAPEVESLNSLDDFLKIKNTLDKSEVVTDMNKSSFYHSLKALVANEIKFSGKTSYDNSSAKNFTDSVVKKHPAFKNLPEFKDLSKKIYSEIKSSIQSKDLVPLNEGPIRDQFNDLAKQMNDECKNIYRSFNGRKDEGIFSKSLRWLKGHIPNNPVGMAQYNADRAMQSVLVNESRPILSQMFKGLSSESDIGHLLGTNYFKKNIVDLGDDFAEECSTNPNYNIIKNPISNSMIKQAHNELNNKLKTNISEVGRKQFLTNSGSTYAINDQLNGYVKNDPSIAMFALMNAKPGDEQAAFAAHMCSEVSSIYKSDKYWRFASRAAGGVGAVAGVVLMASGLGAPIGGALLTVSTAALTGGAIVEGAAAINQYSDASKRQIANNRSLMENRKKIQRYIEVDKSVSKDKFDAAVKGGFAALAIIPGINVLKSTKNLKSSALVVINKGSSGVAKTGKGLAKTQTNVRGVANFSDDVSGVLKNGKQYKKIGTGSNPKTKIGNGSNPKAKAKTGSGPKAKAKTGSGPNPKATFSNSSDLGDIMGNAGSYTAQTIDKIKKAQDLKKLPSEILLETFGKNTATNWKLFTKFNAGKFYKKLAQEMGDPNMSPKKVWRAYTMKFHPDKFVDVTADIKSISKDEWNLLQELFDVLKK